MTGGGGSVKTCFLEGWNRPGNGLKLDEVLRLNSDPTPAETWKSRKMIGCGAITGPESNGLLVIDFDGKGSQAVRAFIKHFRHSPRELSNTLINISGKAGRAKVFLKVPVEWWTELNNHSASWKDEDGNTVLEAIWMNSTGTGRHAVIVGDHPQSSHQNPLFYRWLGGCNPRETEVAEAPEWLIDGVIAQINSSTPKITAEDRRRSGEDDATPFERLKCAQKVQLVQDALPFCRNRKVGTKAGTYEIVRKILAGLLNEFGVDLSVWIVNNSTWEQQNEWGDNNSAEAMIRSLAGTEVREEHRAYIGSLFYEAKSGGWAWPGWALPPLEESALLVEGLKKLINNMNKDSNDPLAVSVWEGKARQQYGIMPDALYRLRLDYYLHDMSYKSVKDGAIGKKTDVIDGLLSRRVHVLAGGSHSGKTTLSSFLASRVLREEHLEVGGTRHSIEPGGKVLILTSDCSDLDMYRELELEGVDVESLASRVKVISGASFNDLISIIRVLETFQPDLVICDCLSSMAVHGVKIGDPSYADPIRLLVRHNGKSWPKAAFLVLHHTSRDEPKRFSGTEQIKAATEELWLYYNPEMLKKQEKTRLLSVSSLRHLEFEKSRNGYAGKKLAVDRDAFQGTWQWNDLSFSRNNPLEYLNENFRKVTNDDWQQPSDWAKQLDLKMHPRMLRRYMAQLVGPVLNEVPMRSKINGRFCPHYQVRDQIREAALAMKSSACDGVNVS